MELGFEQRKELLFRIQSIVKDVGRGIIQQRGVEIFDVADYKGHESSNIDDIARRIVEVSIDERLPDFEGVIRFELRPFAKTLLETPEHQNLVLIVDEIEGTTNTKRCLSAELEYRPSAVVSIAIGTGPLLRDIFASAVYTLDREEVFSALKADEEHFLSFYNGRLIDPASIIPTRGDSRKRVLVIGYSNSHRLKKGEVEQALYNRGLRVYEGCRSSGMDLINLLRNANDAYIDLRHYWSTEDENGKEKEAMLQVYDVAGVIPIVTGCGIKITDAEGNNLEKYGLDDTIPLIAARPDIYELLIETIQPLIERWRGEE